MARPPAGDSNSAAARFDGTDGDDELDDEEDDAGEEEEEGSTEGEEPRLKYQRMGGSVPSLLSGDAASCLTVAERIIALGTHDGTVHLLDYQGNQVFLSN